MPEIELTADQRDRLRGLQRSLEDEMASAYATVRPGDAVAYLLDRYAAEGEVALNDDAGAGDGAETGGREASVAGTETESDDAPADAEETTGDGVETTSASDGLPSGPMALLADHEDVWREGSGEARYEVELPDGSVEEARTRGDVRALLFEHYR
ncbi:MAG: hypothetical protein ABEJ43_08600 [Haloferacaceae archaeon]